RVELFESVIANDLSNLQKEFSNVAMGSYPFKGGTSLVFRSTDEKALEASFKKMVSLIKLMYENAIID
ncbi:MAG: hypothetical protein O3B09_03445, partial [Proteobacteria bacterium]|nr:hypothetical protein [Pseudomonadota bacterium]